jgi:glycosyltransferase involved in cell wall biosynthesis
MLLRSQPSTRVPAVRTSSPTVAAFAIPDVPRVSVVVPTRNEAKNLPHVLPKIPAWVHEVILVDGNSTDNTVQVAKFLRPGIRIVHQKGRGKGNALREGFAAVTGEIIVMLDADGSTDPEEIPAFVGALLAGADFAKGTRFIQGAGTSDMSYFRSMGNRIFVILGRLLFGGSYTDLCYGYNAFWTRLLKKLDLDGDGFEIETMMNLRALYNRLKIVEIASFEADRIHGESNLRAIPDGWRVLKTIFKEFIRSRRLSWSQSKSIQSKTEPLNPALQLLLKETLHFLFDSSEKMSPEAALRTIEALRMAFLMLPELEGGEATPARNAELAQKMTRQFQLRLSYDDTRPQRIVYDIDDTN